MREVRPNSKAMESGRMATEMFLKAFLAAHSGLTEAGAIKISHNLERALRECLAIRPNSELSRLQSQIAWFPSVDSRYEGTTYGHADLWNAYLIAQFAGSALMRSLTDRNMRNTLELALAGHSTKSNAQST
jgi:hypothetical protein